MLKLFFALVCVVLVVCLGDIPSHRMPSMPSFKGTPPQNLVQYSGYISVDDKNHRDLHYWLVLSENDPKNDPLVLWLNGGPGCSSLDGYFYEHGPFHFDSDGELFVNPYRWSKIANILYLEAPAGVGFSYSETAQDYHTNDTKTAIDNYEFIQRFLASYPEYAENDFYISGESYAGIYIPTLAELIVSGENNISLKGLLVGNGLTDHNIDINAHVPFMAGHDMFSQSLWASIQKECKGEYRNPPTQECVKLLEQMELETGDINAYDIYGSCSHRGENRFRLSTPFRAVNADAPCVDAYYASVYLNSDDVKKAMHVEEDIEWELCSSKITYKDIHETVVPIYTNVLLPHKVPILIFSGDTDSVIPQLGTETWVQNLGLKVLKSWHPWVDNDQQVCGYAVSYEGLDFVTVRGAGHMVPQYRPAFALDMFSRFVLHKGF